MSELRDGDILCDVCLQAAPPGSVYVWRGRELETETEMRERSVGGGGGGRLEQPTAGLGTQTAETVDARVMLLLLLVLCVSVSAYYRAPLHTCVDIPRNLSLCHGVGYDKMRLPNLLDHDTVAEVTQQAGSWVPLQNVHCHVDTQLFLCSLFSPVCLDHSIYPCRSLCERVRRGCEGRMRTYGFPWPDMFHCDKFPVDNDMCIASRTKTEPGPPPGKL